MIIDIHTHTFPVKIAERALNTLQGNCHTALFSDGTEAGLQKSEENAKIDLAVVQPVATCPEQVVSINNRVINAFQICPPHGLLSFAAMHPDFSGWESELERIAEANIPGIKLHPPYEKVNVDDQKTINILKKCRDLNLIVLMHSGWDVGVPGHDESHPRRIRRALDTTGQMKLIAAHMAGWKCWSEASCLLKDTGIYLDTAFSLGEMTPAPDHHLWHKNDLQLLTEDEFCAMIQIFGFDHVLFGTDSPWADPLAELDRVRSLPLPQVEIDAICGNNALRLLNLK